MLQVEICAASRYTMAEQAQMAAEAGAGWITVNWTGVPDCDLRPIAADIAAVCRENNVILVFEDHAEAARETGVHGVLCQTPDEALELRRQWGAEPILGAHISDAAQADALLAADIDYCVLDGRQLVSDPLPLITPLPVVCRGDFDAERCLKLIKGGFSGILTGKRLFDCDDPVACIRQLIERL